MRTQINKIDNDWKDIKNKCRTTVNKVHTDNIPDSEFKTNLLISEHSPIRLLKINWLWQGIKYWVSTHYVRHHNGIEKWVSTQRTDRTGFDRDNIGQGALVNFEAEGNAQAVINMGKVRLCYQAALETREWFEDLKLTIKEKESELADVLVPNCIYRCGCPEFQECGYWKNFKERYAKDDLTNIRVRYSLYNKEFYCMKGLDND
jgi:hypothetical protein